MKRIATIKADIDHAAADLEILAASLDAKGEHAKASQLRSVAGALSMASSGLEV